MHTLWHTGDRIEQSADIAFVIINIIIITLLYADMSTVLVCVTYHTHIDTRTRVSYSLRIVSRIYIYIQKRRRARDTRYIRNVVLSLSLRHALHRIPC